MSGQRKEGENRCRYCREDSPQTLNPSPRARSKRLAAVVHVSHIIVLFDFIEDSDELIILDFTFIEGRSKETRIALLAVRWTLSGTPALISEWPRSNDAETM